MSIIGYLFTTLVWIVLLYLIDKKNNYLKISRNMISAIHAFGIVITYFLDIPVYFIIYWSTTYYTLDSLFVLLSMSKMFDIVMVFHHIIAIGIVQQLTDIYIGHFIQYCFFLTEVSNLPMYPVYHLKSLKSNRKILIKFLTFCELIFFVTFRLIMGAIALYKMILSGYATIFIMLTSSIIYIMSVLWTKGVYYQLIKN